MSGKDKNIHYDIQSDVKEVSISHSKQSIKIMFVGTSSVGKSHIINTFIDDMTVRPYGPLLDHPPTKTIEFYTKDVKGKTDSESIVNLLILDTPPNKDDEKIILNCKTVDFIVFTYDVSDLKSFESLNSFIDTLSSYYRYRDKPVNLFILGNIKKVIKLIDQ